MTKPKTLKDIEFTNGCKCYSCKGKRPFVVDTQELKALTIKWIKEDIFRLSGISSTTRRWMKRLDITEEDLK